MNLGIAISALKAGLKVQRKGWNGKDMWLALIPGDQWGLGVGVPFDDGHVDSPKKMPWLGLRTASNTFIPWNASQEDVLAEDWQLI